jgi:hypothetical protein
MSTKSEQHRLIVEPDEGARPVVELIATARDHLRAQQFNLTDPEVPRCGQSEERG